MYPTIKAYKTEQKQFYREKSYVFVYLGVITKEAQANAYVSSNLLDISTQLTNLYADSAIEGYYGTLEEDFYKVDGSMVNVPRDSSLYGLYQGAVSEDVSGAITFRFNGYEHLNIKGLTIDFGEYYPTSFTVTNGSNTYSYENSSSGKYVCQHDNNDGDVFNDTSYITITPTSFVNGDNKRLRIISIMFGIGLVFDNSNLLSTSRSNSIAHISDKLPSKNFSFTVSNIDKRFAKDNPQSAVNFLQEGQEVEFEYGRDLDDGNGGYYIYRIPGGRTALKTWSSNDSEAKFTSVGYLDYLTKKYNKGQYYPNGISLYDLAVDVLTDAGIEAYRIDTYLKNLTTHNPLPVDTNKALLQMIANASRSVLYEDRQGRVVIESSFIPDVVNVSAVYAEDYCNLISVVNDVEIVNFFDMENNYSRLDSDQRYIQREYVSGAYATVGGIIATQSGTDLTGEDAIELETTQDSTLLNTGFVSSSISDDDGYFTENPSGTMTLLSASGFAIDPEPGSVDMHQYDPILTINFEAQWTFYNIQIDFAYIAPTQLIITGYADGSVVNEYEYASDEPFDLSTIFNGEFDEIDSIQIRFSKTAEAHQRIHVNHVAFGNVTDYTLTYTDMPNSPQASSLDKVEYVDSKYYSYSQNQSTESTTLATVQAVIGENEVTTKNAAFDYVLSYKDGLNGTLTIIESGAYYVKFTSTVAGAVTVNGKRFTVSENTYRHQVAEMGDVKTVSNDIIDNIDTAIDVATWIGEHFANDVEYTANYRGEPAIDCDDLIYMENKYVDNNLIRVTDESIETSTGMSFNCKLKARRISYDERT